MHGDSDSTNKYVKEIEKLFKNGELDHVVFLGDYIDRGPDSIQVLSLVVDLKDEIKVIDKVIIGIYTKSLTKKGEYRCLLGLESIN